MVDSRVTNLELKTSGSQPFDLGRILAANLCWFFQAKPRLPELWALPPPSSPPHVSQVEPNFPGPLRREAWHLPSSGHMGELLILTSAVHLPHPKSPLLPLLCSKPNVGSLVRTLPARLTLTLCRSRGPLPSLVQVPCGLGSLRPALPSSHFRNPCPALFILVADRATCPASFQDGKGSGILWLVPWSPTPGQAGQGQAGCGCEAWNRMSC